MDKVNNSYAYSHKTASVDSRVRMAKEETIRKQVMLMAFCK